MVKYFCDLCEEEMPYKGYFQRIAFLNIADDKVNHIEKSTCRRCAQDLANFIISKTSEEKPHQENRKPD